MSSLFALDPAERIVYVSEVSRGLACNCRCIVCKEPLVARQGQVREHHFAHASGREPCHANHESLLHRYAKQVIAEAKSVLVPMHHAVREALGLPESEQGAEPLFLCSVQEEQQMGAVRPDLTAHTLDGVSFAIEVAFTSFCSREKVALFKQMSVPVLEIDLRRFSGEGFDAEAFRAFLLDQTEGKSWLWPQREDPSPLNPQPSLRGPQPTSTAKGVRRLPEEIVTISGRWVSIKQLPSGDIAVRAVGYDPDLVSMIKSIVKANHGTYAPRWMAWNVPRWRASIVRAALRQKSETVSMHLHER